MFPDYTKLVLRDYEKKRAANQLTLRLSQPTTSRLKEECIEVCTRRYSRRDGGALNLFFGEGDDPAVVLKKIERCDPDRLKPLLNFIKGKTAGTDHKNVELLAWLIDFELRPFQIGRRYDTDVQEQKGVELTERNGNDGTEAEDPPTTPVEAGLAVAVKEQDTAESPEPPKPVAAKPRFNLKPAGAVIVAALAGIAIYWLVKTKEAPIPMRLGMEACMYWTGDCYRQVPCNQKRGDTLIVALDPEKLKHFRKITRPDTITKNAKGRVWYLKINGAIEFYTGGGYHPVDPRLRLKPVTDYIIRKYIVGDRESMLLH
ncbi:hypothetical protein [Niabella hirudinis]|uniref:hypothetical protein n=1 Tax=Niabella hirudinis TaxID=1285929 RepID=UPI003EBB4A33